MYSNFLDICEVIEADEATCASGWLHLNKYIGKLEVLPLYLMLEGLHQAAVRLGRTVIPQAGPSAAKVLPVSINRFEQMQDITLNDYHFTGEIKPFGHSARINIQVTETEGSKRIACAEITVAML